MLPDLERCRKTENKIPLLVVTVLSTADDYGKRQAIRESWASPTNSLSVKLFQRGRVVVFFILSIPHLNGQLEKILQEQYEYRDIITTDLTDSYQNLVYKVHACMTFHLQHCSSVPFLLKVDDDVAVNPDRILGDWIWEAGSHRRLYCAVHNNTAPIRNPFNKWYVPKSIWPSKYYPAYCNGPFYIMGNETVKEIAEKSLYFAPFVMEDVFYTGVVAGALNIQISNWTDKIVYLLEPESTDSTLCGRDGSPLTVAHFPLQSPEDMREGFQKLLHSRCHSARRTPFDYVS